MKYTLNNITFEMDYGKMYKFIDPSNPKEAYLVTPHVLVEHFGRSSFLITPIMIGNKYGRSFTVSGGDIRSHIFSGEVGNTTTEEIIENVMNELNIPDLNKLVDVSLLNIIDDENVNIDENFILNHNKIVIACKHLVNILETLQNYSKFKEQSLTNTLNLEQNSTKQHIDKLLDVPPGLKEVFANHKFITPDDLEQHVKKLATLKPPSKSTNNKRNKPVEVDSIGKNNSEEQPSIQESPSTIDGGFVTYATDGIGISYSDPLTGYISPNPKWVSDLEQSGSEQSTEAPE